MEIFKNLSYLFITLSLILKGRSFLTLKNFESNSNVDSFIRNSSLTVVAGNKTVLSCLKEDIRNRVYEDKTQQNNNLFLWKRERDGTYIVWDEYLVGESSQNMRLVSKTLINRLALDLEISNVTRLDEDVYICTYRDNKIFQIHYIDLKVLEPARIHEVGSTPKTVNEKEGNSLKLHCNVTGTPSPKVTWLLELENKEKPLEITDSYSHPSFILHEETILIRELEAEMTGNYTCFASNNVGDMVKRQIQVFVEYLPKVKMHNERIGQFLNHQAMIKAEISGHPITPDDIYWDINGKVQRFRPTSCFIHASSDKYCFSLSKKKLSSSSYIASLLVRLEQDQDYGKYTLVISSEKFGKVKNSTEIYRDYNEMEKRTRIHKASQSMNNNNLKNPVIESRSFPMVSTSYSVSNPKNISTRRDYCFYGIYLMIFHEIYVQISL